MGRFTSEKRPWLAALLGALVTGLGHLYLRRWLRAIGWMLLAGVTAAMFVPESALLAFQSGTPPGLRTVAPLLMVSLLSVVDAYFIAVLTNRERGIADQTVCPSCHREIDADLDFCQWCSEPLVEAPTDDDAPSSF